MPTDADPPIGDRLDPSTLPEQHRGVLSVLVDNDWAQGCTALEVTYLLSRRRFPMEAGVADVSARIADLVRWGLAEAVDPAPDWPDASGKFRASELGREVAT
jgi:hypothetical protein